MTNGQALRSEIDDAGISVTHIADKLNCSRNRVYSIINGSDCTASEIVGITQILHLDKEKRDHIFLAQSVN